MNPLHTLLSAPPAVINVGLPSFADELTAQRVRVVHVDWKPSGLSPKAARSVSALAEHRENGLRIDAANLAALAKVQAAQPMLIGIASAIDVVPGMHPKLVLHAGPPIGWARMSGPLRGAIIGALLYEKLAKTEAEAEELAASGDVEFAPWHEHSGVGPMAGVATARMPVFVVENKTHKNRAYCTLNEGLGKVLRYGAFSPEVLERLRWMEEVLGPVLAATLKLHGELNLRTLIAQALLMGDEVHNRNRAATSLFFREIATSVLDTEFSNEDKRRVLSFIHGNDHFFLNLSMPASKAMLAAAEWTPNSTLVTTMARNGTDFGVRIAGLQDRWFTGPAGRVRGLYFPGYSEEDGNPDIGDSAITETCGLGGFAMAAAPAIVRFVGGTVDLALSVSRRMYAITVGESESFQIPALDFRGTATGVDALAVCEQEILPQINTGVAHKLAGIGQVGAGLVNPPLACFEEAVCAFAERYLSP